MPSSRISSRIADLLSDAREARDAGDWKTTSSLLDAVNALDPGNAEAAAMRAGAATRRQMTLLFCDLVGSTEIADQRDPEEVTAIIEQYRAACVEAVAEFDGYIDDHRGDGMLVLFGYPQVDEDDARRGVLCGLQMVERVQQLSVAGLPGSRLQIRISVHTDLVVVADGITGSTANECARMQALAAPDTVVISDTTQDLVWPWFETESMGPQQLRGVSRAIEVFTVRAALPAPRGRTWRDRVSPFVNRTAEFAAMEWLRPSAADDPATDDPATAGPTTGARAVCVIGPGGMGKTRFTMETAQRLELQPLVCACSRMQREVSLHPFRDLLAQECGMAVDDTPEARLEKLRRRLESLDAAAGTGTATGTGTAGNDLPFLSAVFDIPLELISPPREVQPDRLRRQALIAAAHLVHGHAARMPSLVFIDDIQWADQSTFDLLRVLLTMPGLKLVIAARDGYQPPWSEAEVRRLTLSPLDAAATTELVRHAPGAAALSDERSRELIERSDGVPLFIEELLLTAAQTDSGGISHRSLQFSAYKIPPALRDPLLARLSRPEVDLELAQFASIIGRDVDRDLLQQASGADSTDFERRLRTLLDAGLMELTGAKLRFRHELIREVAYETQRRTVLRERHSTLADLLAGGENAGQRATRVAAAHHLERAGRLAHAVAAHLQIVQADQALGAHEEATGRLTHLLELLESMPAGLERDRTELAVRELRSFSAVTVRGYAATETAEDYPRCRQLIEESVHDADVLPYLIRQWTYYSARGDFVQAEEINDAVARRTEAAGVYFPGAALGKGVVDFFQGDFTQAVSQLRDAVDNGWTADFQVPPEWTLPNDPRAAAFAHLVPSLVVLGDRAAAEQAAYEGIARAESLPFPIGPFSAAYVDSLLATARSIDGDPIGAAETGQHLVTIGERHGFAIWSLSGQMHCLYSAIRLGDHSLLPQLAQVVSTWHDIVAIDSWSPQWFADLGFAHLLAGDPSSALAAFDRSLQIAYDNGSRFYEAEALRGRGQAKAALGKPGAVEDIRQAAFVAERQGAKLFAARAHDCLAVTA